MATDEQTQAPDENPEPIDRQKVHDRQMVEGTLDQAQAELARAKLAWHLTKAGLGDKHLNQTAQDVDRAKKAVEVCESLLEDLSEPPDLDVPELEVAKGVDIDLKRLDPNRAQRRKAGRGR